MLLLQTSMQFPKFTAEILQAILKTAEITAVVKGELREYSVIIKVLPTDDSERYNVKHKFRQLLKFSKEVQVYMKIIKCMYMYGQLEN